MINLHPSATLEGDSINDEHFLFENNPELLPLALAASESQPGLDLKNSAADTISFAAFDRLAYDEYNESGPSSIHMGEPNDVSEAGTSGKEDAISVGQDFSQQGSIQAQTIHIKKARLPRFPNNGMQMNTVTSRSESEDSYRTAASAMEPLNDMPRIPLSERLPKDLEMSTSVSQINKDPARSIKKETPKPSLKQPSIAIGDEFKKPPSFTPPKKQPQAFRARSSIPTSMIPEEFARQCILAAYSSRLNPYALHPAEYSLLRKHISSSQVTIYLNIRNAILRLWTKSPLVHVTSEEAAGCAKDARYFALANVAHQWLLRNGRINFGCAESHKEGIHSTPRTKAKSAKRQTIIVIGAGMSGIGCARQLEALFTQLGTGSAQDVAKPPKIIILEGRKRVGGRIYSHPLKNPGHGNPPTAMRKTAEMGAQIITGFEHGNPLNVIVRGQLALPYHGLRDNTILYDYDGVVVDRDQDIKIEKLYNDVLERASTYRINAPAVRTVEGDRNLIAYGREPPHDNGPSIADLEEATQPSDENFSACPTTTLKKPTSGVEKRAGRAYLFSGGLNPNIPAAAAAQSIGFGLRHGIPETGTLDLDPITHSSNHPTLGGVMDEALRQYQQILDLNPKDMRLLNWHHANLEYANAAKVGQLSLGGWDQDIGNEFEGEHSQIIGGYQQVPRGLWLRPNPLDVRFNSIVKVIHLDEAVDPKAGSAVKVECENGQVFECDRVIVTVPLGVLKEGAIRFDPALPQWKQDVINRMGFGLLNKIILTYEKPFWEEHRDMFGLLNEGDANTSLLPRHYERNRGKFFLFWNCTKTSGRPTLVALMAGDAAHQTENANDDTLIHEVTLKLRKMFLSELIPYPLETIVTRWKRDPFARGSYSYVGPSTEPGDYELMAQSIGPLHFAGEATCGTHPATVHGAYISGLRAAAEVAEAMLGPITVPEPLIPIKPKLDQAHHHSINNVTIANGQQKMQSAPRRRFQEESLETSISNEIWNEIGDRPVKPTKSGVNPFLLFTKDYWHICKDKCDSTRRTASGNTSAKATRAEIRAALGKMWRNATYDEKQPYLEATEIAKIESAASNASFKEHVEKWDRDAARIRQDYLKRNTPIEDTSTQELPNELNGGVRRKCRR